MTRTRPPDDRHRSAALDALHGLLQDVCSAASTADLLAAAGRAVPSERSPRGLRIDQPRNPAFAGLEVRPWDDGAVGLVEIEFAESAAPSWTELETRFGPFTRLPMLDDADPVHQATWWEEPAAVAATILVSRSAGDDSIEHLSIRRGRSRPDH